MNVHSTHEVRRHGTRLSLGIGVLTLVGLGLTFLSPAESADAVPEARVSAADSREGFAITDASWETRWDVTAPELLEADGHILAFASGSERAEGESLRLQAPMVQWQNLDIAVRRDW